MSDASSQQKAEIERNSFQSVLVSTLNTVEGRLLVGVHLRVLDIVLLAGLTDLEGQPHMNEEGPG